MAKQYDGQDPSFKTYDDMSTSQYRFVRVRGEDTVDVCSATTDIMLGVLHTEGDTGQGVIVRTHGHTKIVLGTTITAGQLLGTDNVGRATPLTVGNGGSSAYIGGVCTVGGAVNEIGEMILQSRGRGA